MVHSSGDIEGRPNIQRDIDAIEQALLPLLQKHYFAKEQDADWGVHEAMIAGGEHARERGMPCLVPRCCAGAKPEKPNQAHGVHAQDSGSSCARTG